MGETTDVQYHKREQQSTFKPVEQVHEGEREREGAGWQAALREQNRRRRGRLETTERDLVSQGTSGSKGAESMHAARALSVLS